MAVDIDAAVTDSLVADDEAQNKQFSVPRCAENGAVLVGNRMKRHWWTFPVVMLLLCALYVSRRQFLMPEAHVSDDATTESQKIHLRKLLALYEDVNRPVVKPVECAMDVEEVIFRLMDAGSNVANAVDQECKHDVTGLAKQKCAAIIMNALWAFILAFANIAATISDCAASIQPPAECAATSQRFVGALTILSGCSLWADLACNGNFADPYVNPASHGGIPNHDRLLKEKEQFDSVVAGLSKETGNKSLRKLAVLPSEFIEIEHGSQGLESVSSNHSDHDEHSASRVLEHEEHKGHNVDRAISECVTQVALAAVYLQRASVRIAHSVTDCVPASAGEDGKLRCTVDIMDMLGAFAVTGAFVSGSANSCAEITGHGNEKGTCGYGAAGVIGGAFESVAEGAEFVESCETSDMARQG